jgi:hypothetical protein
MATPLSTDELDHQLDYLLSPVLSSRRTATPLAQLLTPLTRAQQDFVLHWVEIITRTNYEMAYQFAAAAPAALAKLDTAAVEAWILQALDTYDRDGLYHGSQVFKQADAWLPSAAEEHAATIEQHAPVLELYACGLAGRLLQIDVAVEPYLPMLQPISTCTKSSSRCCGRKDVTALSTPMSLQPVPLMPIQIAPEDYSVTLKPCAWKAASQRYCPASPATSHGCAAT